MSEMTEQDALNKSRELWGHTATIYDRSQHDCFNEKRQDKWIGCLEFMDYKGNHIYGNGMTWEAAFADAEERQKGRDSLRKLSNEASGFLGMADSQTHGNTNMAVLKSRIDDARALLETVPAQPSPKMVQLIGAVKTMILWCPRGWIPELDLAMTATRKALDHIEGKGK